MRKRENQNKDKQHEQQRVGLKCFEHRGQRQLQIAVMGVRFMLIGGAGDQAFQMHSRMCVVSMRRFRRKTQAQPLRQKQ